MHYSLEKSNFAQLYQLYMKKYIAMVLLSAGVLSSCGEYNKVLKSTDYEYKYEAAKSYFAKGQNSRAATILEELIPILKGTANGEESLYMLAMTYYNQGDFVTASHYFNTYYTTYPRGTYTELARFHSGKALFLDTPEPRLDQSSTYKAIQELQMFLEYFPASQRFLSCRTSWWRRNTFLPNSITTWALIQEIRCIAARVTIIWQPLSQHRMC